jgi:hypothetical protein
VRLVAADPLPGPDSPPEPEPAARCASLIAEFDEIIVNRFDYQILMLEDRELAAAGSARRQAEAECAAGRYGFGIGLIEDALREIGVVPEPDADQPPDQP